MLSDFASSIPKRKRDAKGDRPLTPKKSVGEGSPFPCQPGLNRKLPGLNAICRGPVIGMGCFAETTCCPLGVGPSPREEACERKESGQGRARTADTGLFRAVLYQLSYLTILDLKRIELEKQKTSRTISCDQFDAERS